MELRANNCPNCGAKVELQENGKVPSYCIYCGSQLLQEEDRQYVHIVDEARLAEVQLRERELEMNRQGAVIDNKTKLQYELKIWRQKAAFWCSIATALLMIGFLLIDDYFPEQGAFLVIASGIMGLTSSTVLAVKAPDNEKGKPNKIFVALKLYGLYALIGFLGAVAVAIMTTD